MGSRRGSRLGSSLLVRNLRPDTSPGEVRVVFEAYGQVRDVYLPLEYYSQRPRGFGFVEFYSEEDAETARRKLDGSWLGGNPIEVIVAKRGRSDPQSMRQRERRGTGSYRNHARSTSSRRSRRKRGRSFSRSPSPYDRRRRSPKGDNRRYRDSRYDVSRYSNEPRHRDYTPRSRRQGSRAASEESRQRATPRDREMRSRESRSKERTVERRNRDVESRRRVMDSVGQETASAGRNGASRDRSVGSPVQEREARRRSAKNDDAGSRGREDSKEREYERRSHSQYGMKL